MNQTASTWLRAYEATKPQHKREQTVVHALAKIADANGATPQMHASQLARRTGLQPETCRSVCRQLRQKGWLELLESSKGKGTSNRLTLPMSASEALALIQAHEQQEDTHVPAATTAKTRAA